MPRSLILAPRVQWAIVPERLDAMRAEARSLISGGFAFPEANDDGDSVLSIAGGLAVVNICGPMVRNPDFIDRYFGACDLCEIEAALRQVQANDSIKAVLLNIDSPGGTVAGTPEVAAAVRDVSKGKYVYAFTAGDMCSAAYWVGAQADAIYATPSACVGSIGVYCANWDTSEMFKAAGVTVEVFASGKYKAAGLDGTSFTKAQRELIQSEVEETAVAFKAAVNLRRNIPAEAMEGQTFSTPAAIANGLLTGSVADFAEAGRRISRMAATGTRGGRLAALLNPARS